MTIGRIPSVEGGIQPTIFDAKADILTATAADTPARLAVGANDTVLTADSSTSTGLKWAAATSGSMTLLTSGTVVNGNASLSLTSISGSYKDLRLILKNWRPVTDGQPIRMQFNSDTGTNYFTQNYNSADASESAFGSTVMTLSSSVDSTTNTGLTYVQIIDYANTVAWKFINVLGLHSGDGSSTSYSNRKSFSGWGSTNAITSIQLFWASGNLNAGTYELYGVN